MPIYAFHCEKCGHAFDRLQKLSDPDPETCPACAAHAVRRTLTAPHFRLAGSGWYETDFKKDGEKKHNLAGNTATPKADAGHSDTPKSDPTPASTPPAASST